MTQKWIACFFWDSICLGWFFCWLDGFFRVVFWGCVGDFWGGGGACFGGFVCCCGVCCCMVLFGGGWVVVVWVLFVLKSPLFSGIYLFCIPTILFSSEPILALLAWVLQPWQWEQFWAMQLDCSSVSLKTCPCRSVRCSCISMLVCQFMSTLLKLTSWTSPLTVLWFVLWRGFGVQTRFLLDETNLRDMFLEYCYCTLVVSVRSVRGTTLGLVQKSQSLLPSLSCNAGGVDVWSSALFHSSAAFMLQCLLMQMWP